MTEIKFPVQLQADNENANDSRVPCMCMVYDVRGLETIFGAVSKQYLNVIAWDCEGNIVKEYDNR